MWKRAAVLDTMERTHLITEAAVGALLGRFEDYRATLKKVARKGAMQRGGRLRPSSISRSMSGASAGCCRSVPLSGRHAGRA